MADSTLLPGEIVVAQAENVLRFDAMAERKSGMSGALYVTNFRVTFLTRAPSSKKSLQSAFQSNPDLNDGQIYAEIQQELHIPLTCILEVNYTTKSLAGTKIKKLVPGLRISAKLEMIEVSCKDLRVLRFGLRFTPKEQRKPIIDAILHYAYPSSVALAFAFSFSRATDTIAGKESNLVPSFRTLSDWLKELSRLNIGQEWRVAEVNADFQTCPTLPSLLVCPASISDADINRMSLLYNDGRIPIWCWSHPQTGVPLLYSAATNTGSSANIDFLEKEEASLFRQLSSVATKADAKGGGVKVFDVSKCCASVRELQQAMQKLRELCVLDTTKTYWNIDSHWLSSLDNTRWQSHIRLSLAAALEVAQFVCDDGRPVILRETNGKDMVFVVGSLAQLILDPYCRTIRGFQSLIQRMWILGGHPFTLRCGHIKAAVDKEERESQESPVFLHFLDCVFQLTTQFSSAFEFSETYLLDLYSGMLSCMFDTFLFNSECQRKYLCETELKGKPMISLWDFMTEQLSDSKVASVFINPLYEFVSSLAGDSTDVSINGDACKVPATSYLKVITLPAAMKFWAGFFLRWLPIVHISVGLGENSFLHLQQMILMNELRVLRHRLAVLKREKDPVDSFLTPNEKLALSAGTSGHDSLFNSDWDTSQLFNTPSTPFVGSLTLSSYTIFGETPRTPPPRDDNDEEQFNTYSKTSFEKNCFSAWASTLNMGLINKVDMVCLSPVGYGV